MKYPPAPLTPFLASPPRIRRRTLIPNEQRELKDHQPTLSASIACRLLKSLASLFVPRILCFQRLAASFAKIPGVGYPRGFSSLFTRSAFRDGRLNFCSSLFSRIYELPPPPHRFASHTFSSTYKSLFSQLACFQKHLRCPLVFSKSIQIAHGVTPPNSEASSMVSVPSAFSVLNSFPLFLIPT
jgi:hypothetical protein